MKTIDVPNFTLGSVKQTRAATHLRAEYITRLHDRGFSLADIINLVTVRCVAKWWLDNKDRLGIMDAQTHFNNVNRLIKKHGSAENAGEAQIDVAYKREKETAEYVYLSTPMFKN